jgi:holo-[acyl-carrier protein] synthase
MRPAASPPAQAPRIGIDLVDLDRFRAVLARRPKLVDRCFTENERQRCASYVDPIPCLAARFAAKEATMKSLGCGLFAISMTEIEVRNEPSGRPLLELSGRALERASLLGIASLGLSLTHSVSTAAAVVLAG